MNLDSLIKNYNRKTTWSFIKPYLKMIKVF